MIVQQSFGVSVKDISWMFPHIGLLAKHYPFAIDEIYITWLIQEKCSMIKLENILKKRMELNE